MVKEINDYLLSSYQWLRMKINSSQPPIFRGLHVDPSGRLSTEACVHGKCVWVCTHTPTYSSRKIHNLGIQRAWCRRGASFPKVLLKELILESWGKQHGESFLKCSQKRAHVFDLISPETKMWTFCVGQYPRSPGQREGVSGAYLGWQAGHHPGAIAQRPRGWGRGAGNKDSQSHFELRVGKVGAQR